MKPAFSLFFILVFFSYAMSPAEHPHFSNFTCQIFFFFFFFADGIRGKETHIYHIIFSSIDWMEDLLAFQVFWTHGVFDETLSWSLISHWDFTYWNQ